MPRHAAKFELQEGAGRVLFLNFFLNDSFWMIIFEWLFLDVYFWYFSF